MFTAQIKRLLQWLRPTSERSRAPKTFVEATSIADATAIMQTLGSGKAANPPVHTRVKYDDGTAEYYMYATAHSGCYVHSGNNTVH